MKQTLVAYGLIDTDWGPMAAARTERGLARTCLPGETNAELAARFAGVKRDDKTFADLAKQFAKYFAGEEPGFDGPVDLGTMPPFFKAVLTEVRKVRFGQTVSYGELAARCGRPAAARAVGGAMSRNPLPLVIPCHRVLAGGGKPGGFSAPGGMDLKMRMLALEAR